MGYRTTYNYDALQRVIGAQFSLSGSNLTSISYTYDSADRVLTAADTAGGNPSTWSMAYDLLDNMTSQTAPEGATGYSYNCGLALMFPQHGMVVSQSPSGGGFPFGGQAAMFPIPAANAPSISGLELDGGNFSALDSVGAIPSPLGGGGCPVVSFM